MKQWFCYRNKLKEDGKSWRAPNKHLQKQFNEITITDFKLCIGEGAGNDSRILGWIDCPTQNCCNSVIGGLGEFACEALTTEQAHDLLERITGWDVTVNGNDLEATVEGKDFVW